MATIATVAPVPMVSPPVAARAPATVVVVVVVVGAVVVVVVVVVGSAVVGANVVVVVVVVEVVDDELDEDELDDELDVEDALDDVVAGSITLRVSSATVTGSTSSPACTSAVVMFQMPTASALVVAVAAIEPVGPLAPFQSHEISVVLIEVQSASTVAPDPDPGDSVRVTVPAVPPETVIVTDAVPVATSVKFAVTIVEAPESMVAAPSTMSPETSADALIGAKTIAAAAAVAAKSGTLRDMTSRR